MYLQNYEIILLVHHVSNFYLVFKRSENDHVRIASFPGEGRLPKEAEQPARRESEERNRLTDRQRKQETDRQIERDRDR